MKNRLDMLRPRPEDLTYQDWINKVILERDNRKKESEKKINTTKLKINNTISKKVSKLENLSDDQLDDLIAFLESKLEGTKND